MLFHVGESVDTLKVKPAGTKHEALVRAAFINNGTVVTGDDQGRLCVWSANLTSYSRRFDT